jgi:hypothetical protein
MKKIFLVVLVLFVLGAGGFYLSGKQGMPQVSEKENSVATPLDTVTPKVEEKKSVINSIKDAMGLGQKMNCTYTDVDSKGMTTSSTITVDGQKYKFTSDVNGEKMYGLFDGTTQYTWTTGVKGQGWKMDKTCMEELGKLAPKRVEDKSAKAPEAPQDIEKSFANAQNVACVPASNEDFSVPTDVVFVDQCEMMKNSLKALEGMKGKLPAGMNIPGN